MTLHAQRPLWLCALAVLLRAGACEAASENAGTPAPAAPARISLWRPQGEGVSWSAANRIAYDMRNAEQFYTIHVADADGSNDVLLTKPPVWPARRHCGSPAWHPGGKWIAFAGEKPKHGGFSFTCIPGFGGHSDLWVIAADGSRVCPLTDIADSSDEGVIIPHFSPDGKHLIWSQRTRGPSLLHQKFGFGAWVIKVGDFHDDPVRPALVNVRTVPVGPESFYECYGYSPDGQQIIFCSDFEQPTVWTSQIFVADADTGANVRRLTDGKDYNEHARFTPDGRAIVWMSTRKTPNRGTDWWVKRLDGSLTERLSYFNLPGHPESTKEKQWACRVSFSPDGRRFVGGVQYSLFKQVGRIYLVDLNEALLARLRAP